MSPKPENMKRPWMKYAPSPSHASPSVSILKRPADDLDSSIEGSPVSAKCIKLEGSLPSRVHFNDNPVSDSVEIPRIPDGKQHHTRKNLNLVAVKTSRLDKGKPFSEHIEASSSREMDSFPSNDVQPSISPIHLDSIIKILNIQVNLNDMPDVKLVSLYEGLVSIRSRIDTLLDSVVQESFSREAKKSSEF